MRPLTNSTVDLIILNRHVRTVKSHAKKLFLYCQILVKIMGLRNRAIVFVIVGIPLKADPSELGST